MKLKSFRQWLKTADSSDKMASDFIGDARNDRTLPIVRSWDTLEGYLHTCRACSGAFEGAAIAWREYQAYRACFA